MTRKKIKLVTVERRGDGVRVTPMDDDDDSWGWIEAGFDQNGTWRTIQKTVVDDAHHLVDKPPQTKMDGELA